MLSPFVAGAVMAVGAPLREILKKLLFRGWSWLLDSTRFYRAGKHVGRLWERLPRS